MTPDDSAKLIASLDASEICASLDTLEAQRQALQVLLRAVRQRDRAFARVADSIGRAEADRYERQFQAIQQTARETKAALEAIEREGRP